MCTEVLINGELVTGLGEVADLLGGLEQIPWSVLSGGNLLVAMREEGGLTDEEIRNNCLCHVDMDAVAARLGGTVDRSDPIVWEIVPADAQEEPA